MEPHNMVYSNPPAKESFTANELCMLKFYLLSNWCLLFLH